MVDVPKPRSWKKERANIDDLKLFLGKLKQLVETRSPGLRVVRFVHQSLGKVLTSFICNRWFKQGVPPRRVVFGSEFRSDGSISIFFTFPEGAGNDVQVTFGTTETFPEITLNIRDKRTIRGLQRWYVITIHDPETQAVYSILIEFFIR